MDEMDRAQQLSEAHREKCLFDHRAGLSHEPGRSDCIDCGEDIPESRRKANPNATRCADCQADYEQ